MGGDLDLRMRGEGDGLDLKLVIGLRQWVCCAERTLCRKVHLALVAGDASTGFSHGGFGGLLGALWCYIRGTIGSFVGRFFGNRTLGCPLGLIIGAD
jgi:hypothetical protein